MAQKDAAKDIRTAVQLEQELQISAAQHGVCVLDIYSSEWGFCKAISDTFRRLLTDAGDGVHLRFFTVECNAVLGCLKGDEHRNPQRPKNIDNIRDTLPEGWQGTLQERQGQSKPYFLFYKEGKKAGFVEGVNTPMIRTRVRELCTVKTPASDFITNSRLQEFWEENFNADESEVPAEKFFKGLLGSFKATVPLNDAEKGILYEAFGIKKDAKEKVVTAEGLQKWFGDDETRTVQQAFNETLPEYEGRAAKVMAEEKKAAAEEAARRKKEEDDARLEKERKQKEAEEEAKRKAKEEAELAAKPPNPQDAINDLMSKFPEFSGESDAVEGDAIKFQTAAAGRSVIFAGPSRIVLSAPEVADQQATADVEQLRNAKPLLSELTTEYGLSLTEVKALVAGIQLQNKDNTLTGFANLSRTLLGADEEDAQALLGKRVNVSASLADCTALKLFTSFAVQAATTAAENNTADLYYCGPSVPVLDGAKTGDELVLGAMSLLSPVSAEGSDVTIKFVGLSNVIRVPNAVLNHWHAVFSLEAAEGNQFTLTFLRLLQEDEFLSAATGYSTQAHADEKRFVDLGKLQVLLAEKGTKAAAPAPVQAKTPEKQATPEQPAVAPPPPAAAEETAPAAAEPEVAPTEEAPAKDEEEFIQDPDGPDGAAQDSAAPKAPANDEEEFIQDPDGPDGAAQDSA